jgi:transcriptional regulator GlxA family with amidase domain
MRAEILLFDGFDELDVFAPFEILAGAGFDARLVSVSPEGLTTSAGGVRLTPHGALSEAPSLLIVPGGGWIDRSGAGAWAEAQRGTLPAAIAGCARAGSTVAAVCTGVMLLAHAGLLTGRPATTHHGAHDELAGYGARLIPDVRVVDDGTIVTAGGVTSGLDLGLWLVERYRGPESAQAQERRIEYTRGPVWHG